MKVGLTIFATDLAIDPIELAREAEARGFSSLYVPEHTHIPTSRRTPPPTGEAELPDEYRRTLDPIVALSAAAAVTERLRLGTAIALVAQRDPIVFAKEVATLDWLSRGRVVLGVGYGWNVDEMESHGVRYGERRRLLREKMLAIEALWEKDVASFEGEQVRLAPSWSWPKPAQRPRPPVLLGGAPGPKLFADIVEWADGWMPIGGKTVQEWLPRLRTMMEEHGRDPGSLHVVPIGVMPSPEKLEHYARIGVTEVALRLPSAPRDPVLRQLDAYARYAKGA